MNCERCGANLALVGKMHRCVPPGTPSPVVATHGTNRTNGTNARRSREAERKARQRAANPEAYRAYMREYMRRRRAGER
jgi:hypothetical protein